MGTPGRLLYASLAVVVLGACGQDPLQSFGLRSSEWINEPTVPTTVLVNTTAPTILPVSALQWANDDVTSENLDDPEAVLVEIYQRREGDRFIQSSRTEIAAVVPGIAFPDRAPNGARWISSQLVFENDGTLSNNPMAAFGIWSAEPYSRSRSVAQMVVLRVFNDADAADELATGTADTSCGRFADRSSNSCELITRAGHDVWVLGESNGSTLIWYDGSYRYEMFGRTFVSPAVLREMSGAMVPLSTIEVEPSEVP